MLAALTLPALAFLMGITGIPGLNALPGLRKAIRNKPAPTAVDSLPPAWKPASRLALEHDFLKPGLPPLGGPYPASLMFVPTADPRRLKVVVEPDSGVYRSTVEVGEMRLGRGFREPLRGFAAASMQRTFEQRWRERSKRDVNTLGALTPTTRTGLQLKLPVALPTPIQSLLGPGGPALNVSGSENIRISGTSNWTNYQVGQIGQRRSLFPSLDMQQDLDIRLEGQLSDRVKVNLLQNSANQVPLANRIAINYRGDEDDLVQALDLGNTNLSLPGTQYVSYSGRNEGLFGVKLATRVGALDFTALASKQEGRSERATFTGGGASGPSSRPPIPDYDYVKGQYFLLYDPNKRNPDRPDQPSIYRIDDASIELYLDDGRNDNNTEAKPGRAYVDPGRALLGSRYEGTAADTASYRGFFNKLTPGPTGDFEILPDYYLFGSFGYKVIRLKQALVTPGDACLAVAYRATPLDVNGNTLGPEIPVGVVHPDSAYLTLKMLRVPRNQPGGTTVTAPDSLAAFTPVRELEMKNFYALGGFGIDPQGFSLRIVRGRAEPPITFASYKPDTIVDYLEVAGLDSWDESSSTPRRDHDFKVDGTTEGGRRAFVDFKNGILFFPDPRPFAPRLANPDSYYFDRVMDYNILRRVRFDGPADSSNAPNPLIYDRMSGQQTTDAKYYLEAQFTAQRSGGDILLGKGSILEGTEVVTVNGERWTRDRDYTIDYDIGRVTLKRQLGPTDQLSIDYSYAPLFQQASKTLLGSAFRLEGRDRSLGGAFMYESKGAQDLRPRLGEEPSRTVIGDLNTEWRFKPDFLTRVVDRLPGVRTTTPSELNVQAEVGASFPNPNTRNEVFLDDMEGVRDAASLSLAIQNWRPMSPPKRAVTMSPTSLGNVALSTRSILADTSVSLPGPDAQRNAELHWYQPVNAVKESDLRPTLEEAQGARNPHNVLALTVPRRPRNAAQDDTLWAGLTYPLDPVGIDLSRAQFIEIWLNDFRDQHRAPGDSVARIRGAPRAKLHIDLGVVAEDQMRAPNRPPDGFLQSEDHGPQRDRQLVVDQEDTGLDGIFDKDNESSAGRPRADLVAADEDAADWDGDNYTGVDEAFEDIDPRKYRHLNGTERNVAITPSPETEDLDLDDNLDSEEDYYEYTIDLDGSSPYLATDVWRDYDNSRLAVDNGWRRYRIPIEDVRRMQFGVPDLTIARHVRVWIEGLLRPDDSQSAGTAVCRPLLMIGGLDIVGSRWLAADLTPRQRDVVRTTVTLNSVNTLDNADYAAPFDPGQTISGNRSLTRREQSMVMEFTNLAPGDTLEALRTFSLSEDYSRYGALTWYATGFNVEGYANGPGDSLYYFVRFSTDERNENYYEVKRRVPASTRGRVAWEAPRADLAAIARLKLVPDSLLRPPILLRTAFGTDGDSIVIKGRPSFTRLRRISFGLINGSTDGIGPTLPSGQLWLDEMRATDVAKDAGYANRLLVNGRLANLMNYNVSWNSADANFLSVGQTRGSGNRTTNFALTTSTDVHRFFEGTGIQLPVSASFTRNTVRPRFSAGDDVVRTGALQEQSTTQLESRSYSTSYTRNWSQRANPILRYTLGGVTANLGRTESKSRGPSGGGRTTSTSGAVNWNVAPRSLLTMGAKWLPVKFYPLPERIFWNYQAAETKTESYTRAQDGTGQILPGTNTRGRTAGVNFGADTRPVDLLRHHIEGTRSLSLDGVRLDRLGFINFGRLTQWRQSFDVSWVQQRGNAWLRPSTRWSSSFGQVNELQSEDLSVKSLSNGQNATVSWTLPFDQLASRSPAGGRPPTATPAAPDTGAAAAQRPRGPGSLRGMFARLGQVQTDVTINRSSSYSRVLGSPSPLYVLGLAENPGLQDTTGRIQAANGNSSGTGLDWRANARSQVSLAFGSSVSVRGSYGDRTTVANQVVNRTRERRFPDLEVDYGKLADVVKLTRFLRAPALRTGWSWSRTWDYQGDRKRLASQSSTHDLRPLLSMRGSLKNGTTADLGINMRNSYREATLLGQSVQRDKNTDVNFTVSRSYSQGQKVNLFGKTSTVRSSVNLSLASVYSRNKSETKVAGSSQRLNQRDETRVSLTGKGSYGFSTNVTGNAVLGYSGNTDHLLNRKRRSIRVELSAQFTF